MPFDREHQPADLAALAAALENVAPKFDVPSGLGHRVLAAVEAEAARANGASNLHVGEVQRPEPSLPKAIEPVRSQSSQRKQRTGFSGFTWPRRFGLAVAAVGVVLFAGTRIGGDQGGGAGTLELEGTLAAVQGSGEGDVAVTLLGTGREIAFASDALPMLPTGDYYELWFVGAGDSPSDPNRISGGTFHPDENAETDVLLHAAVDPRQYPRIEITDEPSDGDPASSGEVVLELDATDLIDPE